MEQYLSGYLNWGMVAPGEFQSALHRGRLQAFIRRSIGRPYRLVPFETAKRKLNLVSRVKRGRQEIRLEQIVGSVGKHELFSRSLLPLCSRLEARWKNIYTLMQSPRGLPPIEVYQVGEDYFILDGHHRASVARYLGNRVIEAWVIEWIV